MARLVALALPVLTGFFVLVGACSKAPQGLPPPVAMTDDALGHYCGMNLTEHPGPKGQIILDGIDQPVWFSSVHDAIAFTMLGEEPKDIRAIYVSDMAKAKSWADPGRDNWMDARQALFVIGSNREGGMGDSEAVPFSSAAAAAAFVQQHGGRIVSLADIPRAYVLGPGAGTTEPGGDNQ